VTTLKTALIHPVVQTLPLGLRAATAVFRNVHAALGLVNVNLSDHRRADNRVWLEPTRASARGEGGRRLRVSYTPRAGEDAVITDAVRRFRRFLLALGCVAPGALTRRRPMGASVHYAGTVPMAREGGDFTADPLGRCRPFENLYLADGSTFPSLPSRNLTFTLMANATRIARAALAG
jgi:choline dehydrogenase-like flavoprotein